MVDYFKVLGLEETAGRAEVKRAYRELAKQWHPDRNKSDQAAAAFILINEAYEFLVDDDRRATHRMHRGRQKSAILQEQREARYREWVERNRKAARERAAAHARQSYDNFTKSKRYRAFRVVNRAYNYLFLGLSIGILLVPFHVLYFADEAERKLYDETTFISMGLTVSLGLLFTYFIWKFLIRNPDEL